VRLVALSLANAVPVTGQLYAIDFALKNIIRVGRGGAREARICRRRQFLPPRLHIINHKIRAFGSSEP
jgi:hypothetical protein